MTRKPPQYFSVDLLEVMRETVNMTSAEAADYHATFWKDLLVCDPRKASSTAAKNTLIRTLKYMAVNELRTKKANEVNAQKRRLEVVRPLFGNVKN